MKELWPSRQRRGSWRQFAATSLRIFYVKVLKLNFATHSLALATQQILCTGPLLVTFSVFDNHDNIQNTGQVLSRYLGLSTSASHDLTALFSDVANVSTGERVIGLVVALLFATAIAATQQRWYEAVWATPRIGSWRSTPRQFAWVLALVIYLLIVLYAGRAGHRVGRRVHASRPAGPIVQLGVSFLFFWWSQHLLLAGAVSWRRLVPGAACMAAGTTLIVGISGAVISGEIHTEVVDYGLVGATFVLSVWLVVLSGVLLGGALLGQILTEIRLANRAAKQDSRN